MDGLLPTASPAPRAGVNTLAGQAFKLIRSDIITGRLMPDTRLRLEELRERCKMGFSPIREALMRLHTEGLVALEPMKGFRVASVSLDHLTDLSRVRIETEAMAIRWSVERGDSAWEADVLGAFHRLSRLHKSTGGDRSDVNEAWRAEHRKFHRALMAACGSPLLMSICDSLFDQAERYVALSIRHTAEPRDDRAEHEAITRAALAHDAEEAVRLTAEHIRRTTEKVAASTELFAVATAPGRHRSRVADAP